MLRRSGFTFVEILVALIVMGLAAALVAPTLVPQRSGRSALQAVVASAREAAARRGETVYLSIDPTGRWRLEGEANPLEPTLGAGFVPPLFASAVTLVISPLGTCAFDARSAAVGGRAVRLAPLTCELVLP